MRKVSLFWTLVVAGGSLVSLIGCGGPSQIGQAQTDEAFPKKSDAEIQQALKSNPEAYAEYQNSKNPQADQ